MQSCVEPHTQAPSQHTCICIYMYKCKNISLLVGWIQGVREFWAISSWLVGVSCWQHHYTENLSTLWYIHIIYMYIPKYPLVARKESVHLFWLRIKMWGMYTALSWRPRKSPANSSLDISWWSTAKRVRGGERYLQLASCYYKLGNQTMHNYTFALLC